MKTRKAQVLLHVLVMSVVLLSVCMAITRQVLQAKILQRKTVAKEEAFSELEGVNAMIWHCLNDSGYPQAGSCSPTAGQRACAPGGASLRFGGVYPNCRVKLDIDR